MLDPMLSFHLTAGGLVLGLALAVYFVSKWFDGGLFSEMITYVLMVWFWTLTRFSLPLILAIGTAHLRAQSPARYDASVWGWLPWIYVGLTGIQVVVLLLKWAYRDYQYDKYEKHFTSEVAKAMTSLGLLVRYEVFYNHHLPKHDAFLRLVVSDSGASILEPRLESLRQELRTQNPDWNVALELRIKNTPH